MGEERDVRDVRDEWEILDNAMGTIEKESDELTAE